MPNKKASLDSVTDSAEHLARKKKNAEAQAAFRERRKSYIGTLEETRSLHFSLSSHPPYSLV
jgi:hypothetical protein